MIRDFRRNNAVFHRPNIMEISCMCAVLKISKQVVYDFIKGCQYLPLIVAKQSCVLGSLESLLLL